MRRPLAYPRFEVGDAVLVEDWIYLQLRVIGCRDIGFRVKKTCFLGDRAFQGLGVREIRQTRRCYSASAGSCSGSCERKWVWRWEWKWESDARRSNSRSPSTK